MNVQETPVSNRYWSTGSSSRPAGVKISPIEPGSIFDEMGLKSSEIIKEVNGEAVSSPEKVADVLGQLKAGDDVIIKVKGRRTRVIQVFLN